MPAEPAKETPHALPLCTLIFLPGQSEPLSEKLIEVGAQIMRLPHFGQNGGKSVEFNFSIRSVRSSPHSSFAQVLIYWHAAIAFRRR
jgi:hypothetical protein